MLGSPLQQLSAASLYGIDDICHHHLLILFTRCCPPGQPASLQQPQLTPVRPLLQCPASTVAAMGYYPKPLSKVKILGMGLAGPLKLEEGTLSRKKASDFGNVQQFAVKKNSSFSVDRLKEHLEVLVIMKCQLDKESAKMAGLGTHMGLKLWLYSSSNPNVVWQHVTNQIGIGKAKQQL
ncbi:UNVERIFIED_CONTAM: hypothetical protein K2H54_065872 [Gekko kuhli]